MAHRDQRCRLQSSQSVAVRHDGRAPGLSSAQTMAPSIAQRYSALIAPDDGDRHLQPEQQQHKELQERQLQVAADLMRTALTLVVGVQKTRRRQRRQPAHYCYMDAYSWTTVDCTWACARQRRVVVDITQRVYRPSSGTKRPRWASRHAPAAPHVSHDVPPVIDL